MKNLRKGLICLSLFFCLFCFYKCSIIDNIFNPDCPTTDEVCELENTSLDTLGHPFKNGELVLSFPQKADMIDTTGVAIDEAYIRNVIKTVYQEIKKESNPIPMDNDFPIDTIIITKCICDDNIFLIQNDSIIGGEANVAEAANANEEIRGEGGIFSLNYLILNDDANIPDNIVQNATLFEPEGIEYSISSSNPIVAILDSGIDASKFTKYPNGIYLKTGEDTICSIGDDKFGYNFIGLGSPNSDIKDLHGHGTVVALAYKSKLDKLDNTLWSNQRLLTVRVLDECNRGTSFSTSCGLSYARKRNANIINCSWGLIFNDIQLQRAVSQIPPSTAIVCSAGNSAKDLNISTNEHFPSGYGFQFQPINLAPLATPVFPPSSIISGNPMTNVNEVLAIDHMFDYPCDPTPVSSNIAPYSSYRQNSFAEPAENVQTIIPNNTCPNKINGTSFAAPALSAGIVHFRKNFIPGTTLAGNSILAGNNNYCYTRYICQ